MNNIKEVFFDLETQMWSSEVEGGFSNIPAFGMSLAVTWDDGNDFRVWLEKDAGDLVQHLEKADKVIGFNSVRFDYGVLSAYVPNVHELLDVKSFDIFTDLESRLGFRLSLESISSATLGKSKAGMAENAIKWFRQGQIDKLIFYCRTDVELTRDIYRFGQEHGFVCYPQMGRLVELPVEW